MNLIRYSRYLVPHPSAPATCVIPKMNQVCVENSSTLRKLTRSSTESTSSPVSPAMSSNVSCRSLAARRNVISMTHRSRIFSNKIGWSEAREASRLHLVKNSNESNVIACSGAGATTFSTKHDSQHDVIMLKVVAPWSQSYNTI